jgi:membrane-bound ClpP family serine protease
LESAATVGIDINQLTVDRGPLETDRVAAFDLRRWGAGGVVAVGALLVVGAAAFYRGLVVGSYALQVLGALCLGGGTLVFFVKVAEDIKPVRAKWGIEGEVGEVVTPVGRGIKGTVFVRSELWSAVSDSYLGPGTKVRVAKAEGLVARVVKLGEQAGAGREGGELRVETDPADR